MEAAGARSCLPKMDGRWKEHPTSCDTTAEPTTTITHSHSLHIRDSMATDNMGNETRGDASIQAYFPPTPIPSPTKPVATPVGDGFTEQEVQNALKPKPAEPWSPPTEYAELDIRDLEPGPKAVTFMGRVANVLDIANTQKNSRSARGCVKVCVRDDGGAVTVSLLLLV